MRVWVTRAQPGAEATAERLRRLGHDPFVHPLLEVRPLDGPLDLTGVAAVAFTSANGVRAFAARDPGRAWPVFAVGDATAEAARRAGFAQAESVAGDVESLARLIDRRRPGLVLHAGAREPAGDLVGELTARGLPARAAALYETVPASPPGTLPPLDAVLVHSPRAGARLAEVGAARGLPALCISPAAAEPLRAAGFGRVATARFPNEAALLKLLGADSRQGS